MPLQIKPDQRKTSRDLFEYSPRKRKVEPKVFGISRNVPNLGASVWRMEEIRAAVAKEVATGDVALKKRPPPESNHNHGTPEYRNSTMNLT